MTSHLGKNLVIVLTLVAAGFFWAWLVFRPYLSDEGIYTDGLRTYDVSTSEGEVRYAVWDLPEVLEGALNTNENERHPAFAPDGEVLVFAVGVDGLGSDLYVADVHEGAMLDPRPLSHLNTGHDEWAPAFSDDALFFATDRPGGQGGFDLWRAPYADGAFGVAQPLPSELDSGPNTEADETDPAPAPDGSLVFASNQKRGVRTDFDLYNARPVDSGDSGYEIDALAVLNTRFEEREPAFTTDGRTLFYASDRADSIGGFDIYRTTLTKNGWVIPQPLLGVNSVRSERDPLPSREGFALFFSVETEDRGTDLFRARSKELYRRPGRPVGWRELLFLGLLLFIALLAGLAKKWEHLEVVYKCLLVSALVHGLLMLWFQGVEPTLSRHGDQNGRIRLRLVPATGEDLTQGKTGVESALPSRPVTGFVEAGPGRLVRAPGAIAGSELSPREHVAPPTLPAPIDPERPKARSDVRLDRRMPAVDVDVSKGTERAEALASRPPELAPTPPPPPVERPALTSVTQLAASEPIRLPSAPIELRDQRPEALEVARPGGLPVVDQPQRTSVNLDRIGEKNASVALGVPNETIEPLDGSRPVFTLEGPEPSTFGVPERVEGVPGERPRTNDVANLDGHEAPGAVAPVLTLPEVEPLDPRVARVQPAIERSIAGRTDSSLRPESEGFEKLSGSTTPGSVDLPGARAGDLPRPLAGAQPEAPQATRTRPSAMDKGAHDPGEFPLERPRQASQAELVGNRESATQERVASASIDIDLRDVAAAESGPVRAGAEPAPIDPFALVAPVAGRAERSTVEEDYVSPAGRAFPRRALPAGPEPGPDRPRAELSAAPDPGGLDRRESTELAPAERDAPSVALELGAPAAVEPEVSPVREAWRPDLDAALGGTLTRSVPEGRAAQGEPLVEQAHGLASAPETRLAPEIGSGGRLDPGAPRETDPLGSDPLGADPQRVDHERAETRSMPPLALQDRPPLGDPGPAGAPPVAPRAAPDALVTSLDPTTISRSRSDTDAPLRFERSPVVRERERETDPGFRPLSTSPADEARDEPVAPAPRPAASETSPFLSRTGQAKRDAVELHGGSAATELAVTRGLAYLAGKQAKRGYWGRPSDEQQKYGHVVIGKTGLALLAFLGAGHTHQSDTLYAERVQLAIDFLLAVQGENGHFGYTASYSHAVATYALAECHAITHDVRLREPIERAVAQILRHQNASLDPELRGGWGYYYADDERSYDRWSRSSITTWQVMALESARLGGIEVPARTFEDAAEFLAGTWDDANGAYRYSHDPQRIGSEYPILPGSHAAALFGLSILGEDIRTGQYDRARRFLLEKAPGGYDYTTTDDFVFNAQGHTYFWYYATLCMFRSGGKAWIAWNESLKYTLLPAQQEDGSWEAHSVYAELAGDDDENRSYTTAMCVLTLETYYRYVTPMLARR